MILKDKYKEDLLKIFSSEKLLYEVWAFGSRVNGDAHEGSDLDLVLRSSNFSKIPLEIINKLKNNIRESNIPFLIELFDWASIPESFHKNIINKHEILYKNF